MTRKFLVPIVLPLDPAAAMEAATKQYVDGQRAGDLLAAWPVGSIYTSTVNTNPSTYFGGTWTSFDPGSALAVNPPAIAGVALYYWRRTA